MSAHHQHCIIYTGKIEPQRLSVEPPFSKRPIQMNLVNKSAYLDLASRLNFGMPIPVHHNLRVKHIGDINPAHMHLLIRYFDHENNTNSLRQMYEKTSTIGNQTLGVQLSKTYLPEEQDDALEDDGHYTLKNPVYGIDRDARPGSRPNISNTSRPSMRFLGFEIAQGVVRNTNADEPKKQRGGRR
jgi:hypothetical protein